MVAQQLIGSAKVRSGKLEGLAARQMVDRLDTDDVAGERAMMLVDVVFERNLGGPRAHDQHLRHVAGETYDLVVELDVVTDMTGP